MKLKNIDPEDIIDLLSIIEESFKIKFSQDELLYISTFGELCDHIKKKIKLDHSNDCTTQQAFYKLRSALLTTLNIPRSDVTTNTLLSDLLPTDSRKTHIREMEAYLGFKLFILRPSHFVMTALMALLFFSTICLFINWQLGLLGIGISIGGYWLAYKTENEFALETVGELAQKMTRDHYLNARRDPNTFNKNEIEKVITDLFSFDLDIEKSNLTREAKFS